jgi:glycosyltransferase involved in cell wall biosynthesis
VRTSGESSPEGTVSLDANSEAPDLPPVSVVIPAFNYAHYLPQAIASVLAQTHGALELLIVDDGSTDNTREVVTGIADPRVRYLWQENAGLSASRNTGLRSAHHEFVAFLDADDLWMPEFLATAMRRFVELPGDFAVVATGTVRMDADGQTRTSPAYTVLPTGELTARFFCLRNRPLSSSVVLKGRACLEAGGFDTTLRSSEDRDMWIRLTTRGQRFFYVDEPLARIRRHPQNMSKNAPRMKANSQRVLARSWRAGAVSRLNVPFWLRAWAIHYFLVAWTHFDDGLRPRAFRYWLTSVLLWPCFLQPRRVFEPSLFRLRALRHFLRTKRP